MSCLPCGACVCVCVQRRRLVAQCAERLAEYRHLVHAAATGNADEAAARVSQNLDTLEAGQVSAHLNPSPQPHTRPRTRRQPPPRVPAHRAATPSLISLAVRRLKMPDVHAESNRIHLVCVRVLGGALVIISASWWNCSGTSYVGSYERCCLWLLWRCARRRLCGNGSDAPHLLLHSTRLSFTPSSIIRSERTLPTYL